MRAWSRISRRRNEPLTEVSPQRRSGRFLCAAPRRFWFRCGFDKRGAAEAQIRAGEFRVVDGNGDDVLTRGESAGEGEAVNDAIVFGTLGARREKEIGLGAGRQDR